MRKREQIPKEVDSMSQAAKESLIKLGLNLNETNPNLAGDIFKKADLSAEEIQQRITDKELEETGKKVMNEMEKGVREKQILENTKKGYKEIIKKARMEGNKQMVKDFELGLKEIEKQEKGE